MDAAAAHAPADLARSLAAIHRTQQRWLNDLDQSCRSEQHFVDAFRRWQEQLTLLRLHLIRAEGRLLQYLLLPPAVREADAPSPDPDPAAWSSRLDQIDAWFRHLRLDTRYRRLEDPLDLNDKATTADIVTDLTTLAVLAADTGAALGRRQALDLAPSGLEDLAWFRVIAPWRTRGRAPLLDCLRWLTDILDEHGDL